jgi:hypothetical protein
MAGRRVEVALTAGAFTYSGSRVGPFEPGKADLPLQTLSTLALTVHPLGGRGGHGICCSPNNARVRLEPDGGAPLAHMWTVGVVGEGDARHAVVTLQWVVFGPLPELAAGLRRCGSVGEVLQSVGAILGPNEPAVMAARGMFGLGSAGGFPVDGYGSETETPPMSSERRRTGGEQGRSRRGGGRHGGGMEGRGMAQERSAGGGEGLVCSVCMTAQPRHAFSNAQLKKESGRKCKQCIEKEQVHVHDSKYIPGRES